MGVLVCLFYLSVVSVWCYLLVMCYGLCGMWLLVVLIVSVMGLRVFGFIEMMIFLLCFMVMLLFVCSYLLLVLFLCVIYMLCLQVFLMCRFWLVGMCNVIILLGCRVNIIFVSIVFMIGFFMVV